MRKNVETTFEQVLRDITQRDKSDSERETSPLKAASDAVILDTTEMDFDESLEALCKLIADRYSI